jgi:hypothetical protein
VQVQKDGILRYGVIEAVRVIQDETTLGTFALSETQADGFAVRTPAASVSEGTYDETQTVTLSTPTDGATIRYTTNGLEPTGSNGAVYDGTPIEIGTTTTLKARATKEGLAASDTLNLRIEIDGTIATPTFDIDEGLYYEPITVFFSSENTEAFVRTTNDADPTDGGDFGESIQISNDTEVTLRVVGTDVGSAYSDEATGSYRVTGYVPDPDLDTATGTFYEPQSVSMSIGMAEAEIRYTTDGSDPTSTSTLYEDPIQILQTATVKARGFRQDWGDSDVVHSTITLKVTDPVADPVTAVFVPADDRLVTLSTVTEGAMVLYSTDGSTPSLEYAGPIEITNTGTTLRFVAEKDGWASSSIISETYTLKLDAPTADPMPADSPSDGTEVTLNAVQGQILYTTNGSTPTFGAAETSIYADSNKPVVSAGKTLKAIARDTGWESSEMLTLTYE